METAKFRFTDQKSVSLEFDGEIATVEKLAESLSTALIKYQAMHSNSSAYLHMQHEKRWMPLNMDGGNQTIMATTSEPRLWAERIAADVLRCWEDIVLHSDNIHRMFNDAIREI
jgi:hypothetical protein